ncbi:hypothetical protein YDYSY3_39290 [Paenibacillus chitinolyticus]|uniref:hypothetical protein n=1 Tax=Paenibacillus chitinolyticus TaxID=79263 RepID=UPI0026E50411|nr:hypothetical protein [Paenibacillus chitinolyticus]GKS12929.1 hypothetical protein YDYSY3_39290 [Paenibacillus chitinolyticus]
MTQQFHVIFNTHTIYVTLDDNKFYKLNKQDLSRELVDDVPSPSKADPIIVLHKIQFDSAKGYLLAVDNPFRIDVETAEVYNKIGFLTDEEVLDYKRANEENTWRT